MENTSGGSFKLKPIASVICISEILISPGSRNAIAINKTRERKRDKLDIETRFTMLLPLLHSFRSKYRPFFPPHPRYFTFLPFSGNKFSPCREKIRRFH